MSLKSQIKKIKAETVFFSVSAVAIGATAGVYVYNTLSTHNAVLQQIADQTKLYALFLEKSLESNISPTTKQ